MFSWAGRGGRRATTAITLGVVGVLALGVLQSSAAEPSSDLGRPAGSEPRTQQGGKYGADDALDGVLGGALAAAVGPGEDTQYPGLPTRTGFQWDGVSSTGITTIPASQQAIRFPVLALAADVGARVVPPPPGYSSAVLSTLKGYVVSPPGAEHPYGDFPSLGVRTLAFGALPVEAVVDISQPRDANDLPIGLSGGQRNPFNASNGLSLYEDAALTGQVELRLSEVRVDGIAADVGSACRTVGPATLSLTGKGYFKRGNVFWRGPETQPTPETLLTPQQVLKDYYTQAVGGLLSGTLDVPAFTGCTGPAGDLSRLITVAVSGVDQPVQARQSTTFNCFPPDKISTCVIPDEFDYPPVPEDD